jgi:hypothetical protein
MTPTDEATFIALWTQGLTHEAMARQLGCPVGTVKSRAYTLVRQGKIHPRPRGGHRTPALTTAEGTPARAPAPAPATTPAATPAATPAPTHTPPAITMVAVPELQEFINRFSALEARVAALEDGTRDPPAPAPTRGHPHPWNHQAVDRAVVTTTHRRRQDRGLD